MQVNRSYPPYGFDAKVSRLWSQLEPMAELSDVTWKYTSLTAAAEAGALIGCIGFPNFRPRAKPYNVATFVAGWFSVSSLGQQW